MPPRRTRRCAAWRASRASRTWWRRSTTRPRAASRSTASTSSAPRSTRPAPRGTAPSPRRPPRSRSVKVTHSLRHPAYGKAPLPNAQRLVCVRLTRLAAHLGVSRVRPQLWYTNKDDLLAGEATLNLNKTNKINTTFNQKQLQTAKYTWVKVRAHLLAGLRNTCPQQHQSSSSRLLDVLPSCRACAELHISIPSAELHSSIPGKQTAAVFACAPRTRRTTSPWSRRTTLSRRRRPWP